MASLGVRVKVRYSEEKGKSPKAKVNRINQDKKGWLGTTRAKADIHNKDKASV